MLFSSFTYAGFFAIVYLLYLATMRCLRMQNVLLLAASYVFYGWWDWRFLGLIVISTLVDFVCGRQLDQRSSTSEEPGAAPRYPHSVRRRRATLAVSACTNLGLLGLFKYYDFFATSCAEMLSAIGLPIEPRLLDVILPVGISFYTFQTLGYTIDVYRGRINAHKSLLDFAVFVAFFPQLVAGPIVRATDLLPQIARRRRLRLTRIYEGGYLVFWGLFKKVVIADNLATLVDRAFAAPEQALGGAVLVAAYAFAIQIYCDFSGYTDIARGCAKALGFEIRRNFNLPYFASNPQDFWRRWHMSLSEWLRDYVYVPLGGNRKGPRRTCINLMLTMILGGLWHGAAWTFVLWGAYQGALLLAHRAAMPWVSALTNGWSARRRALSRVLAVFMFFHLVCFGWLIFRAESVDQLGRLLAALLSPWPWWLVSSANTVAATGFFVLAAYALPLVVMQLLQRIRNDNTFLLHVPATVRGFVYAGMFFGLVMCSGSYDRPFIYFQF